MKQKKLTKYSKKSQNYPKFEHGVLNNILRLQKNNGAKKTKKKIAECRPWHSAKRSFAECQEVALGKEGIFTECRALALGKGPLCRVAGPALGKEFFLKKIDGVGGLGRQVPFFCRVPLFVECCTRQRGLLPSAALCRVPGTLGHSAKPLFAEC